MRQMTVVFFLIWVTTIRAFGQAYPLTFHYDCVIADSKFRRVYTIDQRTNPDMVGYVSLSSPTNILPVQHKGKLIDSLARFIGAPDKSSADTLVIMLEEFLINGVGSPGKCRISMRFFQNMRAGRYSEFFSVDSTYRTARRYTNEELVNMISEALCASAKQVNAKQNTAANNEAGYSFTELAYLGSLEKLKIPIYNTDNPQPGIYLSFEALKANRPSIETNIVIEKKKEGFEVFRYYKNNTKKVKLDPGNIFAVSDGTTLLRVLGDGQFFPITKRGADLFYDRAIASQPPLSNQFDPFLFPDGGSIGTTIRGDLVIRGKNARNTKTIYRYKINYRTGVGHPAGIVNR